MLKGKIKGLVENARMYAHSTCLGLVVRLLCHFLSSSPHSCISSGSVISLLTVPVPDTMGDSSSTTIEKRITHWRIIIGHVNVQSCLLIIFQYQPISLQYSWLSVEQPIRVVYVVYASLGISDTMVDNSNVNMPYWDKLASDNEQLSFLCLNLSQSKLFSWL